jgi:hypothetical protein
VRCVPHGDASGVVLDRDIALLALLELHTHRRRVGRVDDVPRVPNVGELEDQHFGFFVGTRPMLYTAGNDHRLAGCQLDHAVAELYPKAPTPNEKHLIFVLVEMPGEHTQDLHHFELRPIERCDDLRPPVFLDLLELVREIDGCAGAGFHRPIETAACGLAQ